MKKSDYEYITPCGENCGHCEHNTSGECPGCKATEGKCVKMWDNGCYVYACCMSHNVPFCGLCDDFPCQWLVNKGNWSGNIVEHQTALAKVYIKLYK